MEKEEKRGGYTDCPGELCATFLKTQNTFTKTQTYQKILVGLVTLLCVISTIGVKMIWTFKETYAQEYRVVISLLEKQKELIERTRGLEVKFDKFRDRQRELEIFVHDRQPYCGYSEPKNKDRK